MRTALNDEYEHRLRDAFVLDLPADRPLYLLNAWDAGDGFREAFNRGTLAYTSPSLCVHLEQRLRNIDIWAGDGPVIICDPVPFMAMDDEPKFSILVHELSHVIDNGRHFQRLAEPDIREEVISSGKPDDRLSDFFSADVPLWLMHGTGFIRAALHLKHRAELAGEATSFEWLMVAGPMYGLSDPEVYQALLRDEVHQRTGESVASILDSPEPVAFKNQFYDDALGYYQRRCNVIVCDALNSGKTIAEAMRLIAAATGVDPSKLPKSGASDK